MPELLQLELKSGAIAMAQCIQTSITQPETRKACNGDSMNKQISNRTFGNHNQERIQVWKCKGETLYTIFTGKLKLN